jgi:hypothetical protein
VLERRFEITLGNVSETGKVVMAQAEEISKKSGCRKHEKPS